MKQRARLQQILALTIVLLPPVFGFSSQRIFVDRGSLKAPVRSLYFRRSAKATSSATTSTDQDDDHNIEASRRRFLSYTTASALTLLSSCAFAANANAFLEIDVNNALAREYTAFPGLYPTIATKIVNGAKNKTYASKKDVYAVLTSDAEKSKLNEYDASIKISAPDKALQQFKASQICKYECGSRVSNSYRDEQIKQVQADRSVSSGADSSDRAKLGELLNIAID